MWHRLRYAEKHGLDPWTMPGILRHKCDNPKCINPDHLEPGTQADNMRDMVERGRSAKGTKQHLAVLDEPTVLEIRRLYVPRSSTHGLAALGRQFGVNLSTIHQVVTRKTWRHI